MKTTFGVTVLGVLVGVLVAACGAETVEADDEEAGQVSSAIDESCRNKINGDSCGAGGPGGTNPKICYRGKCKQTCGRGMLGGVTESILCGLGVSCRSIAGLYAGNGNTVGGLCNDNVFGHFSEDITTCDNGVRVGGCAYGGGVRYKCVAPGGDSRSSNTLDQRHQWNPCPLGQCRCVEPGSGETR